MPRPRALAILLTLSALAGCDGAEEPCLDPGPPCPECTRSEASDGCVTYVCPSACLSERFDAFEPSDTTPDTNVTVQPLPYRYVRIDDVSGTFDTIDGGADIDAVILEKPSGQQFYAATLEAFDHGAGFGSELDPVEALGAPDAFVNWESGEPICSLDTGSVALGGTGGLLIVGMDADIEPGNALTVLEVGGCTGNDGPEGIPDDIEVSVSVANQIGSQWTFVMGGAGPIVSATVPALPEIQP